MWKLSYGHKFSLQIVLFEDTLVVDVIQTLYLCGFGMSTFKEELM